jgi:hypothetical protein
MGWEYRLLHLGTCDRPLDARELITTVETRQTLKAVLIEEEQRCIGVKQQFTMIGYRCRTSSDPYRRAVGERGANAL